MNILSSYNSEVKVNKPCVLSVSRHTDIPSFYSDWFFDLLKNKEMLLKKRNYYEKIVEENISFEDVRFVVFWSKNPKPLLKRIHELKDYGIGCYIQFTLNDYVRENLERNIPLLEERIETFQLLSEKLGKKSVIWRFDPIIFSDNILIEDIIKKVEYIGDNLCGYTEKLVFSFLDNYKHVKNNLLSEHIRIKDISLKEQEDIAKEISILNKKWKYKLATCAENIDLKKYGINHNKCIDDELIARISYDDKDLMKYLNISIKVKNSLLPLELKENEFYINNDYIGVKNKNNKDKGQRSICGCVKSKDIGEYNTCSNGCVYCYANSIIK